jgi:environmental stress-induced protein Ves
MAWHVVQLEQVAPTPWRNGGGLTRELVVFPVRENWHWRVSVADIEREGPFSLYEGVERWFAVLSGAGVRLRIGDAQHALAATSEPIVFDGAVQAQCELLRGPTRDLNLMVSQGRGSMRRVSGSSALAVSSGAAVALWTGAHPATATFEGVPSAFGPATLAWRHLDLGGRIELDATDALWMEIAP